MKYNQNQLSKTIENIFNNLSFLFILMTCMRFFCTSFYAGNKNYFLISYFYDIIFLLLFMILTISKKKN